MKKQYGEDVYVHGTVLNRHLPCYVGLDIKCNFDTWQ